MASDLQTKLGRKSLPETGLAARIAELCVKPPSAAPDCLGSTL
jgi:hypothetical protein